MPRKLKTAKEEQVALKIAENIKTLLKEKGMRQTDLSALTGIARSTMSDYVNGRTTISMGSLQKISEALGTTKSKLVDLQSDSIEMIGVQKLPIYGEVCCGNGLLALQDIKGYLDTPTSWITGGDHFYLLAKGDSMINAGVVDGSLLLIRRQAIVENGEVAAVMVNDEAMLKRVYREGSTIKLVSENPNYEDIILDERKDVVSIIGKLKKNIGEH
ncbi:TPA: LexA family protein [Bacillus anthracis]|nr:helix-turn-helix domain-containing protein [Bacillus cereus biovar anthracis]HDR6230926.1 helix-turn-helix domain-containing protein [Bacillus cereus biovar anthracis]HDR6240453.1 helix-turn-helix domain-containing protein [Bacillus cereus biovar anthracis]HDR6252397.1 helix-turn-helix domain-containing protein [Bacillus cereus biovar anthracis]HDR6254182.1 helix-turn-helix domain-containing protein [Bacillus cereus biovar anthracis]